jgi:hypothetical protein
MSRPFLMHQPALCQKAYHFANAIKHEAYHFTSVTLLRRSAQSSQIPHASRPTCHTCLDTDWHLLKDAL